MCIYKMAKATEDNVEVYMSYNPLNTSKDVEFKNPLVGVSGFEISSLELSNINYNVIGMQFRTSLGNINFPSGCYTSSTFATTLQNLLNEIAITPFTVTYNQMTKKITMSNSTDFIIYSSNSWPPGFVSLIGQQRGFFPNGDIGPIQEYTFPFPSNDTPDLGYNVLVKILSSLTQTPNQTIGTPFIDIYTDTFPLTNDFGTQKNYAKFKSKRIQFKSKYNVNSLDISIRNSIVGNISDIPWSMTIIFYF